MFCFCPPISITMCRGMEMALHTCTHTCDCLLAAYGIHVLYAEFTCDHTSPPPRPGMQNLLLAEGCQSTLYLPLPGRLHGPRGFRDGRVRTSSEQTPYHMLYVRDTTSNPQASSCGTEDTSREARPPCTF